MKAFVEAHGAKVVKAAKALGVTDADEIKRMQSVCAFLADNPQLISWRAKKHVPDPTDQDGISRLAEKFFLARHSKNWPSAPTTVPDEAVSIVMRAVYGYTKIQTERIKPEHQHAMSSENIVGALLERYIASVLEPHGWVWCAGDFVKAVDFIKYQAKEGGWQPLQVKNRNNTENSSSAAVRNGTEIQKWFRTYAATGKSNWSKFPEPEFKGKLTEEGFYAFLEDYLKLP